MDWACNESRAVVCEDLVAMTKRCLQARTLVTQDATSSERKMKCFTSGSANDSFKKLFVDASELDSIVSSAIKRPRFETLDPEWTSGFPILGIEWQKMENPDLRMLVGM